MTEAHETRSSRCEKYDVQLRCVFLCYPDLFDGPLAAPVGGDEIVERMVRSVSGRLEHGAEVSFLVCTQPFNPSSNRFEIYGSEGTLVITGGSANTGPNHLHGARGKEPLVAMEPPQRFVLVPEGTPAGPPRNVGQAYARLADAVAQDAPFSPDFAHAVKRHKLIEALERSSADGQTVRL